jgi:hypothetical protein
MRRYLFQLLLAVVLLTPGLLVGCAEEMSTYHNSMLGYYISYPSDWTVSQLSEDVITIRSSDSFAAVIVTRLHKLPAGESMFKYSTAYMKYLAETRDDFQLVNLEEISESDYLLEYERGDTRIRNYIMLRGGWVYMIDCFTKQKDFSDYSYWFYRIYYSFRYTATR